MFWQNVIQYYGQNINLGNGFGLITIYYQNGRSQIVTLRPIQTNWGEMLEIISSIGENVHPDAMLSLMEDFYNDSTSGGLVTYEGEISVRNVIPLFAIDNIQVVDMCIQNVAYSADYFEATYFGIDEE